MRKFFWDCAQWGLGSSWGSLAKTWIKWSYFGRYSFVLALGWSLPSTHFSLFGGVYVCVCARACICQASFSTILPLISLRQRLSLNLELSVFLARLPNKAQGSSHHRLPPHSAGVKGKVSIPLQCWGTWGQVLTLTWQTLSPTEPAPRFSISFSKYIFNQKDPQIRKETAARRLKNWTHDISGFESPTLSRETFS